jgi:cytochrome b
LHRYSFDLALILVVIHVLGVLTMCALQRENLVRAMIDGRKHDR